MNSVDMNQYVILAKGHATAPLGFVARRNMLHHDTAPFQLFTDGKKINAENYPELYKMVGTHVPNISSFKEARKHNAAYKLQAKKLFKDVEPSSSNKVKETVKVETSAGAKIDDSSKDQYAFGPEIAAPYKTKQGFSEGGKAKMTREEKKQAEIAKLLEELEEMIGLQSVKSHIKRIVNFQVVAQQRKAKGLPTPVISHHLAFEGPPGTGKTTVARLVARLYHAMGVIQSDTLVETDRAGLVGAHIGETALKTERQIERAKGGVLFIDEAYSLARGGEKDYGREAVATLLKAMEDKRDSLVVIFAGYSKEMENLWRINSGLSSRVPQRNRINFPAYAPNELTEIGLLIAEKNGYSLSQQAQEEIMDKSEKVIKDGHFGNGRWVRDLMETAMMNQATRIAQEGGELDEIHSVDLDLYIQL